jgi:VanZ family protein
VSEDVVLRYRVWWHGIAWLMVAVVVLGSLVRMPEFASGVQGGDKFQHLMAYFALSFFHGQLGLRKNQYRYRVLGFFLLGVGLEFAQSQLGYRSMDMQDALANTVGLLFGWVLAQAAPDYLKRFEARLQRGRDHSST